jgi:hypothetical protein
LTEFSALFFKDKQLIMHVTQLGVGQGQVDVSQLVRVHIEVVVCDEAADELAVQVVVGGVDVPYARVGVGVAVGAGAEVAV